jgi:hypothetical protein
MHHHHTSANDKSLAGSQPAGPTKKGQQTNIGEAEQPSTSQTPPKEKAPKLSQTLLQEFKKAAKRVLRQLDTPKPARRRKSGETESSFASFAKRLFQRRFIAILPWTWRDTTNPFHDPCNLSHSWDPPGPAGSGAFDQQIQGPTEPPGLEHHDLS